MATMEIPHGDWRRFFDRFTKMHGGWKVTVEVLSDRMGDQIEAENVALAGIDATDENGGCIEITFAESGAQHVLHTIASPTHVWLEQDDQGTDRAIEIEAEGEKTLLIFRSALPPESVDGI